MATTNRPITTLAPRPKPGGDGGVVGGGGGVVGGCDTGHEGSGWLTVLDGTGLRRPLRGIVYSR